MIRRFVRAVIGAAAVLCVTALQCQAPLGPEGLIPAGDYRLVRSIAEAGWEVPSPQGTEGACGKLIDARLLIDVNGGVLHTRTIEHPVDGLSVTTVQELRPELTRSRGSGVTYLEYHGWLEEIVAQVEPKAGNPQFMVLYVEQDFRANVCPRRELVMRYTVGGVNN